MIEQTSVTSAKEQVIKGLDNTNALIVLEKGKKALLGAILRSLLPVKAAVDQGRQQVPCVSNQLFYMNISACEGQGREVKKAQQEIVIPKGIEPGTTFRVKKGGHGYGDLRIRIAVEEHKYFKRERQDIYTEKIISLSQAVLGGIIEVHTLYGKKAIELQPGTNTGMMYRIAGYGVQYPNDHRKGDHYAKIVVHIPTSLSKKQKEAMKAFAALEDPIKEEEPDI